MSGQFLSTFIMDLFTLDTTGFLFTEIAGDWNVLSADFGDGYEAAATVGAPEGTRSWSVKLDVLPGDGQASTIADSLTAVPGFLETEDGSYLLLAADGSRLLLGEGFRLSTRAEYLWRAFRISKAAGNQAFWIEVEDPDDGDRKLFLASFVDNRMSYAVLCAKIYSTGLQLRQRRLSGVDSPLLAP